MNHSSGCMYIHSILHGKAPLILMALLKQNCALVLGLIHSPQKTTTPLDNLPNPVLPHTRSESLLFPSIERRFRKLSAPVLVKIETQSVNDYGVSDKALTVWHMYLRYMCGIGTTVVLCSVS